MLGDVRNTAQACARCACCPCCMPRPEAIRHAPAVNCMLRLVVYVWGKLCASPSLLSASLALLAVPHCMRYPRVPFFMYNSSLLWQSCHQASGILSCHSRLVVAPVAACRCEHPGLGIFVW